MPNIFFISSNVFFNLCGASYNIIVFLSNFIFSKTSCFSLLFVGRNPIKVNSFVLNPEHISADIPATGPGIGITSISFSIASFTIASPGSEMPGVPASDTIATFFTL